MATTARKANHWKLNPNINIELFDADSINNDNLINQLLVFKQSDLTFDLIMNLFGSFGDKEPLCHQYDTFEVPAKAYYYYDNKGKEYRNQTAFTTTIGLWLFNVIFMRDFNFSFLFGGYINTSITKKKFNSINETLVYAIMEDKINTDDYKKYLDYTQFFMPFESILSANHTEAILSCSKKINAKKKELLKKYKDRFEAGDFAAAEDMEKELLAYAGELLKDDPCMDVYDSGAGSSWGNNFKNMYVMKGAIKDPDPNAKKQFNIATSNFVDGITSDEYSLLANSLAAGPYSRAKKTETGGYWEKLFAPAFQALQLGAPGSDCKTDRYIEITITEKNIDILMYNYIIKPDGSLEELTLETKDKYMNKKVKMRFSIYCKSKTGICHRCAGNFFYRRGATNIGLATIQVPAKLKLVSMKSFHDSTISTAMIDPMKAFNIKS